MRTIPTLTFLMMVGAGIGVVVGIHTLGSTQPKTTLVSPLALSQVSTESKILGLTKSSTKTLPKSVSILLLGLDARIGDTRPRCDAIHLFQLHPWAHSLRITTIPRGTIVAGDTLPDGGTYIGNLCHYQGIEAVMKKVAGLTGVTPDYYATIGFSQSVGILRTLGLPTTSTLQFLRSRNTALGDHQRSHNQAVFMRDFILTNTKYVAKIPKPLRYLLYQLVQTNMEYETASQLFEDFIQNGIADSPANIELVTVPDLGHSINDRHYSSVVTTAIEGQGSEGDFLTYQATVEGYLKSLIARATNQLQLKRSKAAYELIKTPFSQRIWLQVEEADTRELYHYQIVEIMMRSNPDRGAASSLLLDYIAEMETFGYGNYAQKATQLLDSFTSSPEA